MQIAPAPNQTVRYVDGSAMVISKMAKTGVGIIGLGAASSNNDRPAFRIIFVNHSNSDVNFGLENIQVTDEHGRPVHIYSREELVRSAKTAALMRAFAIGMSAGAQSFAAAQPSTTTYSGNYYGGYNGTSNYGVYNRYGENLGSINGYSSGTAYGSVSGSSTTYNPAQAAMANQAIQANEANQLGASQAQLGGEMGEASMELAENTVPPQRSIEGLLITKRARQMNFRVVVEGEVHTASFIVN